MEEQAFELPPWSYYQNQYQTEIEEQEPEPPAPPPRQKPSFIIMSPLSKLPRELIPLCKCLIDGESSESIVVPERKKLVLSAVTRTEQYLKEHRIQDFMSYLMRKVIASREPNPAVYLTQLLDECMLFRSGFGLPPVIYEDRHLEAVIKSFDPGNRGWLTAGQVRRAFTLLGLPPVDLGEPVPKETLFNFLRETQIQELYNLVWAGVGGKARSHASDTSETSVPTKSPPGPTPLSATPQNL